MPCRLSSSMQPTMTAPPYVLSSGTTFSNRSSPSSRLIELTTALPWQCLSASSMTRASVESIMSGAFTLRVICAMNRSMSAASSRSGLARQMSRTWALLRTWARPISAASANCSATISSLNRREPMTFVRSPTGVVGHDLGPGGAVQADREEVGVLEGDVECLHALARQHRARRLDRAADHQRPVHAGLAHGAADPDGGGLHVQRILLGLEQQRVHAAVDQPSRLDRIGLADLVEGHVARDRDRARPRAHGAEDEPRAGRLAWEDGRGPRDLVGPLAESGLSEDVRV